MKSVFYPKLLTVLKEKYTRKQLIDDSIAGIIVGIVALPLSIAFAIASGVTPDKGLLTAIIAGFLISVLGGSRVQIGGPTGAFVVIIYGIVQQYGIDGLIISTVLAGIILVLFGIARLGTVIKLIPYPLVVGFTSGIALTIFTTQVKDFLGLQITDMPAEFIGKWHTLFASLGSINITALIIATSTVIISFNFKYISKRIPGSIVAIILATVVVTYFKLPVETIASRFGEIPSTFPTPHWPTIEWANMSGYLKPAFTIALLGAIESLLSAVVADGMVGSNHRSNTELIGQGIANIASALFGGIPATGAIARTATNIRNGGRTPVAGIVHALVLLLIMLFFGKWAKLIPLSCLAGILVVVAYNMSEWHSFVAVLKGSKYDIIVLLVTFFLTVLIDLTVAIEVGMVLASLLFLQRMTQAGTIAPLSKEVMSEEDFAEDNERYNIKKGVELYEINGPFFFGVAHKYRETFANLNLKTKVLILRMRHVPFIDATGARNLAELIKMLHGRKVKVVLSGVTPLLLEELVQARIDFLVGRKNICENIYSAIERADEIIALHQTEKHTHESN